MLARGIAIISDGLASSVRLLDIDGRQIGGMVSKIILNVEVPNGPITAQVTFTEVELSVVADLG